MTRLWKRLDTDERCGACGDHILRGHPICLLMLNGVRRPLLRCEHCLGPAPPDALNTLDTNLAEIARTKGTEP